MGQIPLSGELLKEKVMPISHEFGNTSKFGFRGTKWTIPHKNREMGLIDSAC
jgi:shikimate 5-dehydrogenase